MTERPLGPHYGYDPAETPRYGPCPACGMTLRTDRLDLLAEHRDVCKPSLTLALELRAGQ